MRRGLLAVYRGVEYKAFDAGDKVLLVANSDSDRALGFAPVSNGKLLLTVPRSNLDSYCDISNWGVHKGIQVQIVAERDGKIFVVTMDGPPPDELGFEREDKVTWAKWVSPGEMDRMWEELTPLRASWEER